MDSHDSAEPAAKSYQVSPMQSHDCGVSSSHREVAGSHNVRTVGGRKGLVSAAGNCYPRTGHAIACRWTIPAGHPLGNACYLVTSSPCFSGSHQLCYSTPQQLVGSQEGVLSTPGILGPLL